MLLIPLVKMHGLFLLKNKKGIRITNGIQKVLDESNRQPNKLRVDKNSEFYNRSMKLWLKECVRNAFNT